MSWFENQENYIDKRKSGLPERAERLCKECKKCFIGRFDLKKCKEHLNNKNYI
jgi:hypothetical protein